jgi:hypothetical protein
MAWAPGLLRLYVVSELLIALACLLISIALLRVVQRRQKFRFNRVLFCFAACGVAFAVTHAMAALALWHTPTWQSRQ